MNPCFCAARSAVISNVKYLGAIICVDCRRDQVVESNVEALWDHIGELLDDFPPLECGNYFRSCGYVSS